MTEFAAGPGYDMHLRKTLHPTPSNRGRSHPFDQPRPRADYQTVIIARRIATVLFVVFIPVLLVTSNIRYLVGDVSFYERGLRDYDAEQVTSVPLYELDRAAGEIVSYFENDSDELRIVVSERDREVPLFNEQEVSHMRDVKSLIRFMFRLNEISLAYVILYIGGSVLWARERSIRQLAFEALGGIGVGLAILVSLGVFALTGFDRFWTTFHRIAFPNGLWQLDPDTDRLIQMFPEPFWQEATYILGAMTLVEVSGIVLLALGYLVNSRRAQQPARPIRPGRRAAPTSS